MKRLLVALLVLLPAAASAGEKAPVTEVLRFTNSASTVKYNVMEAVALNAAAATRTLILTTGRNWPTIKVNVFYTYSAATSVTLTSSCSLDGTNYGVIQSRKITSGASELSDFADTKTGTSSVDFQVQLGVKGCEKFKIVFSGGGTPGAGDLITVQVSAVAGN